MNITNNISWMLPAKNNCFKTTKHYLKYGCCVFFISTCLTVSGCSWLNKDSGDEMEEDVSQTIVAPIANFTRSINDGTAPLSVNFTSTSVAGSASITNWQWDFGNGDSSDQENPSYTYTEQGNYSVSLTITTADGSDLLTLTDAIEVLAGDVVLTLAIVNANGSKIDDVEVTSSTLDISSASPSEHGLELAISPTLKPSLLRLKKPGYLPGFVYSEFIGVKHTQAVTLLTRAEPIKVDLTLGGQYVGENGVMVDFNGSAFVKEDGSGVFGEAELYITPIDTSKRATFNAFPGGFLGTQDNANTLEELFSYGVVDITFEQDGEILELKNGENAKLTLPLYANKDLVGNDLVAGDTIPLWYLNEETGIWFYESNGTVVQDPISPTGFSLSANTSHFTMFNADVNPIIIDGPIDPVSETPSICLLDLELLGGVVGQAYLYTLEYLSPNQPGSRRTRPWFYDGSNLNHYIAKGFTIRADVSDGVNSGTTTFSCSNSGTVFAQIQLVKSIPEFRHFDVETIPDFTLNNNNNYEILTNTLRIGAYFINATAATFTSELMPNPMILGPSIYIDHTYTLTQPESSTIIATIAHDNTAIVATDEVNFIKEHPPISRFYYAYFAPSSFETLLSWTDIAGADKIEVYQLGNDANATGTLLTSVNALSLTDKQLAFVGELKGYLRVEISNQYGVTVKIVKISERGCPPETDLCSQAPV